MRVISQDRCYSYDFDRTMFWKQDGVMYAHIVGDTRDRMVGNYKSDERAAEVFEDMHKAYSPYRLIYKSVPVEQIQIGIDLKNFIVPQIEKSSIDCTEVSDSIVYFMPKE